MFWYFVWIKCFLYWINRTSFKCMAMSCASWHSCIWCQHNVSFLNYFISFFCFLHPCEPWLSDSGTKLSDWHHVKPFFHGVLIPRSLRKTKTARKIEPPKIKIGRKMQKKPLLHILNTQQVALARVYTLVETVCMHAYCTHKQNLICYPCLMKSM